MTKARKDPDKDMPRMVGLSEVAYRLGIHLDTARKWALRGKLPFTRIAGKIRVPLEAVERVAKKGT
jgi:excisionase family DNA binding protein